MTWTMPRPVLQAVAGLLGLLAIGSFAMGILNAPEHGRLPGERLGGKAAAGAGLIDATEATPLSQERIEGPAPVEKADKKDAADNAEAADTDEADNPAPPTLPVNAIRPATNVQAPGAGNVTDSGPPPEEPPH